MPACKENAKNRVLIPKFRSPEIAHRNFLAAGKIKPVWEVNNVTVF
jgi:hypothetical protein